MQILHCDNTFSAKGLTVDATLFTTVSDYICSLNKYDIIIYIFHISLNILFYKININSACETDKNEAIKIGTLIHDVLNGISDVQIKNEK